jgi:TPP-dependent pyruvate/acetoin dehydrogenase alpha subunit
MVSRLAAPFASENVAAGTSIPDSPEDLLCDADRDSLLRYMLLMRGIEERGLQLYKQGKVPGSFYDGRGQEAISVGATFALASEDPVCSPLIRDLGAHLVRGTDPVEIFRHYMGRENALSRGREGNVHFGNPQLGVVGMVSMLPDMMVVAVGMAMAFKLRREARCALSFFGDGATSQGDWHEAMNWAALQRLPVIFVLEDNELAYSTPPERQYAAHPVERAQAYGVAATQVNGNDVESVFAATWRARERALSGDGPTLISARTMRMHGHGAHDPATYVEPARLAYWRKRDPVGLYTAQRCGSGADTSAIREQVATALEAAVAAALQTPMANAADVLDGVFCQSEAQVLGTAGHAPFSAHHHRTTTS